MEDDPLSLAQQISVAISKPTVPPKTIEDDALSLAQQIKEFGYQWQEKDFILDDNLPNPRTPSDERCIPPASEAHLGTLDLLPLELLHDIVAQLDVHNLTAFGHANRRALEIVESLPLYKTITKHASNIIRGVQAIEAGRGMMLETLYEALCTAECERCSYFGGYLYILTCKRFCYDCFTKSERSLPMKEDRAIRMFGFDRRILDALPRMRNIPGTYSLFQKERKEKVNYVDSGSAHSLYEVISTMEQEPSDISTQELQELSKRAARTRAERSQSRFPVKMSYDFDSHEDARFMAVVRVPWLNKATGDLEWGINCSACKKYLNRRFQPPYFAPEYTVASFGEHLGAYSKIRDGEHCRE